ncbi:hypothetical protein SCP_0211120 [Sparassis crispa]|uniref:Uncharacterized protein n=1 Tax=Sparassis crispa TaxID=139825 RepID=A0A401GCM3_9APHY|nr:hypothetical protein SCP_0211120 [Sparassis crispa]GBE79910.1 hypothetical protein SCP_0211120 [Sparassis crispa]
MSSSSSSNAAASEIPAYESQSYPTSGSPGGNSCDSNATTSASPSSTTSNTSRPKQKSKSWTRRRRTSCSSLTPVGTIRCSSDDVRGYYKLDALAVLQGYRQFHFGRALVLALHDCVRRGLASATVKAHSQIHATLTESPPLAATISRTQWVTEPLCGADLGIRPRNVLATLHRRVLMASSSPLGYP